MAETMCPKCGKMSMLPFYDTPPQSGGAGIQAYLKGYACTNPDCGNNLFYKDGKLVMLPIVKVAPGQQDAGWKTRDR